LSSEEVRDFEAADRAGRILPCLSQAPGRRAVSQSYHEDETQPEARFFTLYFFNFKQNTLGDVAAGTLMRPLSGIFGQNYVPACQ
jgi:hypothetical protein